MPTRFPPWRYPHLFALWQQWLAHGQNHQLDRWLEQQFRQHKQFGKKDRQAYRDAFFIAMRYQQLAHALEYSYQHQAPDWATWDQHWQATTNNNDAALWYWLLLRAGIDCNAPTELADGAKRLAHFTQHAQAWPKAPLLSPHYLLWQGMRPQWSALLAQRQHASNWSDNQLHSFITTLNTAAPICLRPQRGDTAQLAATLAREGIDTSPAHYGLIARSPLNIQRSPSYSRGEFELQDTASQALAATVTAASCDTIWDVCAGGGGKSLAFASNAPAAAIVATDIRSNALKQLQQRAKRGGFNNINAVVHDACQPLPTALQPPQGFDWVFIDAPCSAAGTWRRAADARWRLAAIDELLTLQATILRTAAPRVRVHGHLIYATCSWRHDENEAQVAAFLAAQPQFKLIVQACVGSPMMDADTMFYAKLQRVQ